MTGLREMVVVGGQEADLTEERQRDDTKTRRLCDVALTLTFPRSRYDRRRACVIGRLFIPF